MSGPLGSMNPLKNPQCTAHSKRSGERCKRPAMNGTTVCRNHGGAAPQVKRKAQQRLAEAADRMAKELLGIATSSEVSDAVKLAAIKDALDRAGLKPSTSVDVSVGGPAAWEQMVSGLTTTTRAESRAARGLVDDTPRMILPAPRTDVPLDVEVVEPTAERGGDAVNDAKRENGPDTPGAELIPMEDALELLARQQATGKRK